MKPRITKRDGKWIIRFRHLRAECEKFSEACATARFWLECAAREREAGIGWNGTEWV